MKSRLSIIIPFANEGIEVDNTIKSILEHSNGNIDIIIINDASDDGYDYTYLVDKYPIKYVVNKERLGVAASRDLGVNMCETEYFLLLDAHMRFYDSEWATKIVQELDKNSRMILCAQTKILKKVNDQIIEKKIKEIYWGAYINFYSPIEYLEPQWTGTNCLSLSTNDKEAKKIPCILGAGYATSKSYWQYLHGLEGLMSYGNDEVLISIKVWLEGGICKLMPNVTIGHIYRTFSPYVHHVEKRIYNRMFIAYMLLPTIYQKKLNAIEKTKYSQKYFEAWKLFYERFSTIEQAKKNFEQIRTKDFFAFERFNSKYKYIEKESKEKKDKFLLKSILYIVSNICKSDDIGLVNGKLGVTILLYHYAVYTKNRYITSLANSFLDEVIKQAGKNISLDIPTGILGVGWGISFLYQHKFISLSINDVLVDIDKKVMEISPRRMENLNLEYGLGGIVRYVLSRLYDNKNKSEQVFSSDFLYELYVKAKSIINDGIYNMCPEVYIDYILFYEKRKELTLSSVYDILMLPGWNKYSKASSDTSLHGLSGMCLEYLIMQLNRLDSFQ